MANLFIFGILSAAILFLSWRTLFHVKSHGFYRFFGWEGLAWLLAVNYRHWFENPFSINQLISWFLLFYSIWLVGAGMYEILRKGKPSSARNDSKLFSFEKTTELVETGVFRHTRHPLYASLIFVTWGILLKNPSVDLCIISLVSTILFYLTSRYDEKECFAYFGEKYSTYMKHTKMFIPYIF